MMNGNPANGGGDESTTNTQINQQIPVEQQQQGMVKNEPQQYDLATAQQQQLAYTPITNAANMQRPDSGCFLRCRGLPFAASENDVRSFFGGFNKNDNELY